MMYFSRRTVKTVSIILTLEIFIGFLPWRELSADSATHGEYTSHPFTVTYDQNSTWNNSTQGQFVLTNTSGYEVTSLGLQGECLVSILQVLALPQLLLVRCWCLWWLLLIMDTVCVC
ncbi:MAG: hypothetical protein J5778_08865 [Clostridiales bacterium]|nr:hypothetical protein [Clostridiales bacterium]